MLEFGQPSGPLCIWQCFYIPRLNLSIFVAIHDYEKNEWGGKRLFERCLKELHFWSGSAWSWEYRWRYISLFIHLPHSTPLFTKRLPQFFQPRINKSSIFAHFSVLGNFSQLCIFSKFITLSFQEIISSTRGCVHLCATLCVCVTLCAPQKQNVELPSTYTDF